jgi:small subunit ribosomal protein S9
MSAQPNEIWATGRRKSATARVRMRPGTGRLRVNGKPIEEYFPSESVRGFIGQPLAVTDTVSHVDIDANIAGGGPIGQAGAFRHGITRALVKKDEAYRPVLKDCGMLTRDSRVKERKKSGQPGARKRFQFSKR